MNEPTNISSLLVEALLRAIREAVREEMQAWHPTSSSDVDRLLDAREAALLLSVSEDWLYRNAKKLPFARKLGPKMLRFSASGIQKYLATRKLG